MISERLLAHNSPSPLAFSCKIGEKLMEELWLPPMISERLCGSTDTVLVDLLCSLLGAKIMKRLRKISRLLTIKM